MQLATDKMDIRTLKLGTDWKNEVLQWRQLIFHFVYQLLQLVHMLGTEFGLSCDQIYYQ